MRSGFCPQHGAAQFPSPPRHEWASAGTRWPSPGRNAASGPFSWHFLFRVQVLWNRMHPKPRGQAMGQATEVCLRVAPADGSSVSRHVGVRVPVLHRSGWPLSEWSGEAHGGPGPCRRVHALIAQRRRRVVEFALRLVSLPRPLPICHETRLAEALTSLMSPAFTGQQRGVWLDEDRAGELVGGRLQWKLGVRRRGRAA